LVFILGNKQRKNIKEDRKYYKMNLIDTIIQDEEEEDDE